MRAARFDWPALMQAGMRGLGLRPHEFWALTPAEFELMLGTGAGIAPLRRGGLEALMADFPDTPNEKKDE
ncbi:rcc01693 family protein [Roseovarius sp. MMSF_3281]|uniref:rcc01693 family protein n=1 Tax=Roseovarius sp. MMSF_3281 TaxID=3046694 RepID=UPI00273D4D42|nr:rcc01693 family protein [Roseovarius sp. MMSF_3281]